MLLEYLLNKLKWRLFIIWISLRWIVKTNLGDIVIYNGKEYFVNNGVVPGHWDIIENKDYYVSNNKNNSNIKDMKYKKNTLLSISDSEYGQYDDSISNDSIMAGLFIADYPIDSKNEINYSDSYNSDY